MQFDKCPDSVLTHFSVENDHASWTEDNISLFHSDRCIVRDGLIAYNNSPTGDGLMFEGSSYCVAEDVDAIQQGNGSFAAVPNGSKPSGGCLFVRCRTRDSYNSMRDGRAAPSSNGLSFYVKASPGHSLHSITDCHFDNLANPKNLVWQTDALRPGWSLTRQNFTAKEPIRLMFGW